MARQLCVRRSRLCGESERVRLRDNEFKVESIKIKRYEYSR